MQQGGESKRIKLSVDLTRYDPRLVLGALGNTIPNVKIGLYGSSDSFVAVKFDSGATLDIAYRSLTIIN